MFSLLRGRSGRLIVLALLSLSPGCWAEPTPEPPAQVRPVKTVEVSPIGASVSRAWPGRIEPSQNAEMSFSVAGDITSLAIEEGMVVEKGAVLAKIDARQLRARLDSELAQLAFEQTEFDRTSTLVKSGAIARAELDRRQRALSVSKAAVSEARKALADATMIAPFSGTIAKKHVDNFESVQAKQLVLVLQDASSLEIVTHVSQRDYAATAPGLTVAQRNARIEGRIHVVLDTAPDVEILAQLKEMASVPDLITGTYEVTWSFDPPEGLTVTPGMTAKVMLDFPAAPAEADVGRSVQVPIEAVVGSDDGGAHVWVINRETMTVSAVPVTTGELLGDSIEVSDGLAGGELLATSGVHVLRDGMTVTRFEDIYGDVRLAR